jgi:hypothetical protein
VSEQPRPAWTEPRSLAEVLARHARGEPIFPDDPPPERSDGGPKRRWREKLWQVVIDHLPGGQIASDFGARVDYALEHGTPCPISKDTARRGLRIWATMAARAGRSFLQLPAWALGKAIGRARETARLLRDWAEANHLIDVLGGRVRMWHNSAGQLIQVHAANVLIFPEPDPPPLPDDVPRPAKPPLLTRGPVTSWLAQLGLTLRATGWWNRIRTAPPATAPP